MHGQLPPLCRIEFVVATLVCCVVERHAAPEGCAELAVLRPDPVVVVQCGAAADRTRLLAAVGEVEGQAPLPLRLVEHLVKLTHQDHCRLHPHTQLAALLEHFWDARTGHDDAVVVDDAVARHHRGQLVSLRVVKARRCRVVALSAQE